ncbi:MAG: hypothetical protein AB7O56_08075 [Bauldia sp.]
MAITTSEVEAFFAAYGKRSDDALHDPPVEDVDGVVASFAPYFVGASPKGVLGGANDAAFRDAVPKGFARYRAIGGTAMTVTAVDVTLFDEWSAMARVGWRFAYTRPGDGTSGTIAFANHYFLNKADGHLRIFAYVTPDEEGAMREHGLIP